MCSVNVFALHVGLKSRAKMPTQVVSKEKDGGKVHYINFIFFNHQAAIKFMYESQLSDLNIFVPPKYVDCTTSGNSLYIAT